MAKKHRFLHDTSALLDAEESRQGQSVTSRAIGRAGIRTAHTVRNAGLASRFYNPRAPKTGGHPHAEDIGKVDQSAVTANCCPRCRQPNVVAKLSNGTDVLYCERGCRYAVPLPTSDLITRN